MKRRLPVMRARKKKNDSTSSSFSQADKRRKFVHYYKKNKHEIIFIYFIYEYALVERDVFLRRNKFWQRIFK